MTRDELIARYKSLQQLQQQAEATLLPLPSVVQVSIGLKESQGVTSDDISFIVYVDRKRGLNELAADEVIPAEVLGVKTDVVEIRARQQETDESEYRPLKGGIQIGNGSGALGTLGCVAKRTADGATVFLSNHHVMFASGKGVGDKIGQPDFSESCCCSCGEIGTIAAGKVGGLVDCAIAAIKAGIGNVQTINQIGNIAGTADPVPGEVVRKVGRTTGLTTGKVKDPSAPGINDRGISFTDQIDIVPLDGVTLFSNAGDSGSVVVNSLNQIIGLHWGRVGLVSTSCKITNVMAELGITIPTAGDESAVAASPARMVTEAPPLPTDREILLSRVERTMRRTEQGRATLNVVLEFRFEVMRLIQSQRAVGAAWQRHQGPAFLAALFRSLKEPTYRIPREMEGISARSLLMSMAVVLEEHGSPGLRAAIGRHALALLKAAERHDTIEGMLAQLTGRGRPVAVA